VYPNVAMPHALWTLQGVQSLEAAPVKDMAGHEHTQYKWSQISKGTLSANEYDALSRDLVNFLVYVGEPAANDRRAIGIIVLFALGLLFIFVYLLKREFWKDVK
jgi:ubiquinol-cytochrome c reductase cytochrome c1 subunit